VSKKRKKQPIPPLMTLKVGPVRYGTFTAIGMRDANDAPIYGHCDHKGGRITVNLDYAPSHQRSTLFHEAIHAVDEVYGIGLTEDQTRLLEVGLLSLIDDNPQLLAFEGVG
jgi:hypothetical protein